MNERNPYQQYGYDNYDQPPQAAPSQTQGVANKSLASRVSMKFKNPLFATAALLLSASAFAAIVVMSYPGDSDTQNDVPVVKADKMAFKSAPEDAGGMDIPFQDSTVFSSLRDGELRESAPIENLLAREEPVDRFAAFEEEAVKAMKDDADAITAEVEGVSDDAIDITEAVVAKAEVETPVEIKKIVQKTEETAPQDVAEAATDAQRRPQKLHAPGSSPETLAFVRSVLDKKDAGSTSEVATKTTTTNTVSKIEPAAGAAVGANIQAGNYFVQLGSVTSVSGAQGEWGKLQKSYTQLGGISHRVQEANLGERGTFYRIQAGPMSKDSANSLCDTIKAQKPGACLVVK